MGWSDISLSLTGPVVQDLRTHFTQRWNFIFDEKYGKKNEGTYHRLPDTGSGAQQGGYYPPPPQQQRGFEGEGEGERGFGDEEGDGERGLFGRGGGFRDKLTSHISEGYHQMEHRYGQQHSSHPQPQQQSHTGHSAQRGSVECQITRSASKWSHNVSTEVGVLFAAMKWR